MIDEITAARAMIAIIAVTMFMQSLLMSIHLGVKSLLGREFWFEFLFIIFGLNSVRQAYMLLNEERRKSNENNSSTAKRVLDPLRLYIFRNRAK